MKLLILILFLLSACNLDTKKTGLHKNSQSIQESKGNGVFLQSLKVDDPVINIGNYKTDTIKQVWIESGWTYGSKNPFSTVIQKDSFQQVLILFGRLSDNWNDSILLKYNDSYFGWNRVLFNTYQNDKDTAFVIKKVNDKEVILDTFILTR